MRWNRSTFALISKTFLVMSLVWNLDAQTSTAPTVAADRMH